MRARIAWMIALALPMAHVAKASRAPEPVRSLVDSELRRRMSAGEAIECESFEQLARSEARRRMLVEGDRDILTQEFAEDADVTRPVAARIAPPRSAAILYFALRPACDGSGPFAEYALRQAEGLADLEPLLELIGSSAEFTDENRVMAVGLAAHAAPDRLAWTLKLLRCGEPPDVVMRVLREAERCPGMLPRAVARALVLEQLAKDDEIRREAGWFAWRHRHAVAPEDLVPLLLYVSVHEGRCRDLFAERRDWSDAADALLDEADAAYAAARSSEDAVAR